jgi:hypothetical protein
MTGLTPEEYVRQTGERLLADGSEVSTVQLPSGSALVGYRGQFKLAWMATKLHLFTVVVAVPQATASLLYTLTSESAQYAKSTKGALRGLQSGVAVIPALVSYDVQPDAREYAQSRPEKAFALFHLPAVVDLAAGQTYSYTGRMIWGGIYASWLRAHLAATLPSPTPPSPTPPSPRDI